MLSHSSLSGAIATERERALRKKAHHAWKRRQRGELKLRDATDADGTHLLRLARLDSQGRPPSGKLIVAEEDGVLVAAIAVESGAVIADPFKATAAIVAMLRLRADHLRRDDTPGSERTIPLSLRRLRARGAAA